MPTVNQVLGRPEGCTCPMWDRRETDGSEIGPCETCERASDERRAAVAGLNALPCPRDREFWIVTEDGDAQQVAYSDDHMLYERREVYGRTDGESGSWEPVEILGWTDDYDAAKAAEALLAEAP